MAENINFAFKLIQSFHVAAIDAEHQLRVFVPQIVGIRLPAVCFINFCVHFICMNIACGNKACQQADPNHYL